MTKVIAFYLPQFHRIPENDAWWGEGFTDWVSAKGAKKLFPGHNQPRKPLHHDYYNLLEKKTMKRQARLAQKAGIDGFCIYHYWFGEKQLLEKPAEKLLEWKDIPMNFCFSWANETWITSWSKLVGNAWSDGKEEKTDNINKDGILVKQTYGNEGEWERHFHYLLPFFKDNRYLKHNGMPIFVIYHPDDIPCMQEMKEYWNSLAKQNGLSGIYFIGTNCSKKSKAILNASLRYEPGYSYANTFQKKLLWENIWELLKRQIPILPTAISAERIWREILSAKWEKKEYPGCFVDFDATPRKGKNGAVYLWNNPRFFLKRLSKLYEKCLEEKKEYLFITAWNEWGEGAYLEPDEKNGYDYLKAIRYVKKHKSNGRKCK